jgi:UDP-N-acetylglucosamine 2-epimerase
VNAAGQSVLLCMGTRPEIIKMAPVYHALLASRLRPLVLHTGQHLEMAETMYEFFAIKPDLSLHLERVRDTLSHLSSLMLDKVGNVLEQSQAVAVLVHGDTSSALMAALAAFYQRVPVGHVEAGLRSHNAFDPFPEEKNREIIARLASLHFAPTVQARLNLLSEGVRAQTIHVVGNTIVDAVHLAKRLETAGAIPPGFVEAGLERLPSMVGEHRILLVTAHRRENLGDPLNHIAKAVRILLETNVDMLVVWSVHANPKVAEAVHAAFSDVAPGPRSRLFLCDPLNYPTFMWVLNRAWLALTDSGGVQEEAASIHVPILVLRDTTERPELISEGAGLLVGTSTDRIVSQVNELALNPNAAQAMRDASNPFGDGHAAGRVVELLSHTLAINRS